MQPTRLVRDATARVAVAAVAVLTAVLAFAGSAPRVGESAAVRAVNGLPGALRPVLWLPMQAGTRAGVAVVSAVLLTARRSRAAVAAALAGGSAWLLATALKHLPAARGRPALLVPGVVPRDSTDPASAGYVSAHTAVAVALAVTVAPALPRPWRLPAYALAGVVAFARLYAGAHLPLDLLAGAALGVLCGLAVRRLLRPAPRPR